MCIRDRGTETVRRMSSPPKGRDYMGDWPVRCTSSEDMKVEPFEGCVVVLALATATIAGQQSSSQSDAPRSTPSTTTSSSPPPPPASPPAPPLLQLPEVGRPA